MIPLPFLPVIAAGLVPLIVGSLWYHPSVFGKKWMSQKRVTPEMAERSSKLSLHSTAVMFVLGMVAAVLLSRILYALAIDSFAGALSTGLWLWLGFMVPASINRVLWDHESLATYFIETGQWLLSLCVMAIVLTYY